MKICVLPLQVTTHLDLHFPKANSYCVLLLISVLLINDGYWSTCQLLVKVWSGFSLIPFVMTKFSSVFTLTEHLWQLNCSEVLCHKNVKNKFLIILLSLFWLQYNQLFFSGSGSISTFKASPTRKD